MQPPRLVSYARWATVVGGVLALVLVAAMALSVRSDHVPDRTATPGATAAVVERPAAADPAGSRPGRPVALRIPALGVHVPVVAVAMDPGGALLPPADPGVVGWWSGGARPGSRYGTALMTGHTVHDGGGVFDDLAALDVGDPVVVVTREGVLTFGVRRVRELSKERLAATAERLFSQRGAPCLVLVTCADWDAGQYLGNTVVVARAH